TRYASAWQPNALTMSFSAPGRSVSVSPTSQRKRTVAASVHAAAPSADMGRTLRSGGGGGWDGCAGSGGKLGLTGRPSSSAPQIRRDAALRQRVDGELG